MPKPYPEDTRKAVLDAYREVGASEASRLHDIPIRTVFAWASDEGLTSYAEDEKKRNERIKAKRDAIYELLHDRVLEMLMRMDGPANPSDLRWLTTAIGTLIDKYRLEGGESTAHTYHEGTDDIDRSVAQLVEELKRSAQAEA